ncbi:Uncharacterised protein [Porphyromonas cangingivalis]|nr:Uncharacterised protein [Porphyromonas cangingivalis]
MKRLITMTVTLLMLLSCEGKKQQTNEITPEQIEAGAKWIERLIVNDDHEVVIDKIDYDKVMSPRLLEFFGDAMTVYGPSDMTDEEYQVAEQEYKKKWEGIYPLKEDDYALFGVGNGETMSLYDLKITHKEGLSYDVYIYYDERISTLTEVTLIPHEEAFLIDYAAMHFFDEPVLHGKEGDLPYRTVEERSEKTSAFEALVEAHGGSFPEGLMAEFGDLSDPETCIKKWGAPAFESKILSGGYDYTYLEHGITQFLSYKYDNFSVTWAVYKTDMALSPTLHRFLTDRKGFGFGGICIGVPEWDKERVATYLKRWFAEERVTLYPKDDFYDERLVVALSDDVHIEMTVYFSEDGLVRLMVFDRDNRF